MKAVILSAGKGTRMRPLTDTRSKVVLPVAGKPLIQHTIEKLKKHGIKEIILIVNYKKETIKKELGDGEELGVDISYVEQDKPRGTADAIKAVEDKVNQDFLVLNGDLHLTADLYPIIKNDFENVIAVKKVEDISRYGEIKQKNGIIREINEKPDEKRKGHANTGIYRFTPEIFKAIDKTQESSRGEYEITDSIEILMEKENVGCAEIEGEWIDVGRPWDLLKANKTKSKEIERKINGVVEEGATIKGKVKIEEGTTIKSGAYIEGPTHIGKNCEIGPNCYIRPHTTIQPQVKIGNAVEIKNSIILPKTDIGHLSYVGDSIIGARCNLGAGTITANLRHDEKNIKMNVKGEKKDTGRRKLGVIIGDKAKTGIHTSINCGTKINTKQTTKPNQTIKKDK
ncbi:bifunctional sugar-1-phosphate nucleotidylyltransferase/acetyltransferase [Methanonatronarchaeum sp. AMET-Sl]|uniref:bifunctional sugar-1-phosphate nucleotidylyltransferase/acetyltransferase n=1 Tax=Methanonatronarchaeum sp. AMET-Sl TaxID=3037654 RepID=UPI00244DF978|nr:bifunctional sugar-1-phosphate nucleotidylyltransferase/acetyltransferase [Methanonatronarchaeum sp. AMET-Sl]WGI17664.1 sugar phosphate nucleotidyltransferase [Methanonatronarchaeum sp. AMET-Sl]